jgi:A/G-specific adenine glycosylase
MMRKVYPEMSEASGRRAISEHAWIAGALAEWFTENARDLPWRQEDARLGRRDAYRSLVSEVMLQQTQVSRVMEKFEEFLERFPTPERLAAAEEQEVLAAWSGLGYYRRARLLHGAAKDIVERHGGEVPEDPQTLIGITGIGRYTAGAIASIVFGHAAPIVDGNVSRVLMRLRADDRPPQDRAVAKDNWADAEELACAAASVAKTNEGLMELGALVCTPKAPRCDVCPLRRCCAAKAAGQQDRIPAPKRAASRTVVHHTAVLVGDEDGRQLIERRPDSGLWASMWQAPTDESDLGAVGPSSVLRRLGLGGRARKQGEFVHMTSHREVRFRVYSAGGAMRAAELDSLGRMPGRAVISRSEIGDFAIANPHRRMLEGRG